MVTPEDPAKSGAGEQAQVAFHALFLSQCNISCKASRVCLNPFMIPGLAVSLTQLQDDWKDEFSVNVHYGVCELVADIFEVLAFILMLVVETVGP